MSLLHVSFCHGTPLNVVRLAMMVQEVVDVCRAATRRNLQIYRARFSAITPRDIDRALRRLDTVNQKVVAAVDVRTEIDLRLGAVFTRFQSGEHSGMGGIVVAVSNCLVVGTGLLGGRFENVGKVISYGIHEQSLLQARFLSRLGSNGCRLFSVGPCQFPTLGFVAERFKMRQNFKPRNFWSIQVKHQQVRKISVSALLPHVRVPYRDNPLLL